MSLSAVWHDVECGGYERDLPLWRELASGSPGPVLDVGAGTGRVALDLARHGAEVVGLDADADLVAALRERAAGLPVEAVVGDARDFHLDRRFGLIIVPMQTLQLLGGAAGRAAFLRCAQEHLMSGGRVAASLADALESFDADTDVPPDPDVATIDGVRFSSLPLAVIDEGEQAAIHRLRQTLAPDGSQTEVADVIRLDRVTADEVADEAEALGFRVEAHRQVPQTHEYVGSTVVVLHA